MYHTIRFRNWGKKIIFFWPYSNKFCPYMHTQTETFKIGKMAPAFFFAFEKMILLKNSQHTHTEREREKVKWNHPYSIVVYGKFGIRRWCWNTVQILCIDFVCLFFFVVCIFRLVHFLWCKCTRARIAKTKRKITDKNSVQQSQRRQRFVWACACLSPPVCVLVVRSFFMLLLMLLLLP